MTNDRDIRRGLALAAARQMIIAARTAPKAKGLDLIETSLTNKPEELNALAERMEKLYEENHLKFFLRDADDLCKLFLLGSAVESRDRAETITCVWFHLIVTCLSGIRFSTQRGIKDPRETVSAILCVKLLSCLGV